MQKRVKKKMNRSDVYCVDLSPFFGSEQGECRPCVILQNDIGNRYSGTTIIAPMTTKLKHRLPTHVQISTADKGLNLNSVIMTEQIRVVDKQRFGNFVCRLSKETMERVDKAIEISLALHLNKEERGEEEVNEIIVINNHELKTKEYNGQRVVTFKDIDMVHERPDGTAKRNFSTNKKHFVEGEDFHTISKKEVGTDFVQTYGFSENAPFGMIITESGYLMLVKSFTDDLAWEVQRKLVKSYFNKKKQLTVQEMMREQLGMIDGHEERIKALEDTMTIDHGQQRVLERTVNKTVIDLLGGNQSNAYHEISRKVFAECNRDLKNHFNVNSRDDVPRKDYEQAIEYAKSWRPCTNTMLMIRDCNAQMNI